MANSDVGSLDIERILVTGGGEFIESHPMRYLCSQWHFVGRWIEGSVIILRGKCG